MKTLIKNVLYNLDQDNVEDPQFHWEYLEYEMGNFSTHFSKGFARNMKTERTYLENKLPLNIPKLMKNIIRSTKKKKRLFFFLVTSY